MKSDFERVKRGLNIVNVASRYSSKLEKKFLNPAPCCNHNDCCSLDERTQLFHCFSCGKSGSVIDLIMAGEGCDKAAALRVGADMAGIEVGEYGNTSAHNYNQEKKESSKERMFRLTAEYYHHNAVRAGSPARAWFCGTRGHKEETFNDMKVGWTDDGLLAYLQDQGFTVSEILNNGLARDKDSDGNSITPKDYFWKGLAVFPVKSFDGKIISFTCKDPSRKYPGLMIRGETKKWFLNYQSISKHDEFFIVEGQNDEASLKDVGCHNVLGTAGAPGKEQITLLKNFCDGKTLYLWFDNDPEKDPRKNEGGAHHTRFIYQGLSGSGVTVKIIMHPGSGKDPDEYIRTWKVNRKDILELKNTALTPLEWEIEQLKRILDQKDRFQTMKDRKIPQEINSLTSLGEKEIYMDRVSKAVGISAKAVADLLESSTDLYKEISNMFGGETGIKKGDPLRLAEHIFKWFSNGGGRFFKTSDGKVWLFYHGRIFEIDNNLDFNTLMYRLTKLPACEKPGSTVWYFLRMMCNDKGDLIDLVSWLFTDRENDTVYLNLNSPHNKIIRIAPGAEPTILDNGTNEHSILLSSSPQIRPFELQPGASEREGFHLMKALILDTIPCEKPQRYFLACWMITTFLMDYQGDRGLCQVIGTSGLGKSKVAERVSQLIYGENYVGRGTSAGDVRIATHNPVNFIDNLENRDLNQQRLDFLLLLANSATKPKAKAGSDTDVVYQRLKSMGMSTSIEPFPGKYPELINRTFPVVLDHQYRVHGYMHDEVMRSILKSRNLILSSVFKMIGRSVLPRLHERTDWSKFIHTKYPGHNKERMNEHICMMLLILEGMLEYIPYKSGIPMKKQAEEILERWIASFEEQAHQTAITSNTLLTLMDGLAREIFIKIRGKGSDLVFTEHPEFREVKVKVYDDPEYLETFYLTDKFEEISEEEDELTVTIQRLEFIVTSSDLYTVFNRLCASQHIKNPFETPTALGARISNDKNIMKRGGWEYISRKDGQAQYKKVQGKYFWRFSKKLKIG